MIGDGTGRRSDGVSRLPIRSVIRPNRATVQPLLRCCVEPVVAVRLGIADRSGTRPGVRRRRGPVVLVERRLCRAWPGVAVGAATGAAPPGVVTEVSTASTETGSTNATVPARRPSPEACRAPLALGGCTVALTCGPAAARRRARSAPAAGPVPAHGRSRARVDSRPERRLRRAPPGRRLRCSPPKQRRSPPEQHPCCSPPEQHPCCSPPKQHPCCSPRSSIRAVHRRSSIRAVHRRSGPCAVLHGETGGAVHRRGSDAESVTAQSAVGELDDTTGNGSVSMCRAATASATVRLRAGSVDEAGTSPKCSPVQSSGVGAAASSPFRRRPTMRTMAATTVTSTPTPMGTSTSADRGSCIVPHRTPEKATLCTRTHPERNHRSTV